jgi:muramidase (phage lysozyme)
MALPAILGASRAVLSGSKLARTANIGSKLLGRRKKDPPGEKTEGSRGEIVSTPSTSLVPSVSVVSKQTTSETPRVSTPKSSPGKSTLEEDVRYIREKTVEIDKLLKSSFAQRKKEEKQRQKRVKSLLRTRKEARFEKKSGSGMLGKAGSVVKKPASGIFDWLKNYVTSIVVGFVAIKLLPLLPVLEPIIKGIFKVGEFLIDAAGFLLNGLVTFIDWGYKAYDATAGFIKNIGGEDAAKVFEKFSGVLTTFANLAVIAGLVAVKSGGGPDFGGGRKGGTRIGKGGKTTGITGRGVGKTRTTSPAAARRFASRFGRDAAEKRFGKDAVSSLGGKFGRSRLTNAVRSGATAVADKIGGRGGVKALASLGKIGKFIKVPVIGGIISSVLALMSGESPGKALFAGIGTTIGGALGTLIPIPVVGTILGGFIGDYVGNLLGTLFFGGGIKEAGAQLGRDILGVFTGVGKGAKAIFDWVIGGGLFTLLKNVGGGLLKFVGYLLNPGGLLFDALKGGAGAIKFIVGGLFNLIKGIGGGALRLVNYLLNPGGLFWDLLKLGGNIAKSIFNFAVNAIGSSIEFIKDFIGGIFSRFIGNFPTIGIPEGWGIQTTLGKILGWIPFLQPYVEDGRLTRFPDLSMFIPGLGLPFFLAHLGKSMFPGSFFDSMPSGVSDVWRGAKNVVENITEGVSNAVEGTKRATGGIADALTFNLFDFDKQNKVEKKEEGGTVGLSDSGKEAKLESTKLVPTFSTPDLSISDVGATLKGAGSSGEKAGKLYKPAGIVALIELGNELKKLPIVGEAMAAALRIAVGITPQSSAFKNIGADLINFTSLESVEGIADSQGDIKQGVSKFETGGEIDAVVSIDSADTALKADNLGRFLKSEMSGLKLSTVDEAEKGAEGLASFFSNFLGALGSMVPGAPNLSGAGSDPGAPGSAPSASGASGGATSSKFGTPEQKKLLDAIAFAEGTTGSYGTLYGGKVIPELAAGEMTIAEVLKMQKSKMYKGESVYGSGYDSNATGRYQFMSYVLEEEIGIQGVDPSEKFTPELQDRLILNRMSRMRGVTAALLAEEGISDKVIDMLAPEFASFPNLIGPDAQGRVGTNSSYYGQGGKSAAEIKKAYGDSTGEASAIAIAEPTTPMVPGADPSSTTPNIQTADPSSTPKGEGSKIAGELGRFLDSKGLGGWGSGTHQHPEHPPWPKESGHATNSLHYESQGARALDIGGFGPIAYRENGYTGTDDQTQILAAISEFNSSKGATPVELLHEGNEPSGHWNHVHVAYQGGGLIQKPTINRSSGLQETMAYDKRSAKVMIQPMIIEKSVPSDPIPTSSGGGGMSMGSGQVNSNADKFFAG